MSTLFIIVWYHQCVTGGFRSAHGMAEAINGNACQSESTFPGQGV